jgi:hypothetical protein
MGAYQGYYSAMIIFKKIRAYLLCMYVSHAPHVRYFNYSVGP